VVGRNTRTVFLRLRANADRKPAARFARMGKVCKRRYDSRLCRRCGAGRPPPDAPVEPTPAPRPWIDGRQSAVRTWRTTERAPLDAVLLDRRSSPSKPAADRESSVSRDTFPCASNSVYAGTGLERLESDWHDPRRGFGGQIVFGDEQITRQAVVPDQRGVDGDLRSLVTWWAKRFNLFVARSMAPVGRVSFHSLPRASAPPPSRQRVGGSASRSALGV